MRQRIITLSLLLLLFFAAASIPQGTQAISSTVVISEFRTRGPNGGNDEFIELYNLSAGPVNISGWQIRGSNANGDVSTRAVISSGTVLNPGCRYLLTNPNSIGGPYSGSIPGNQTFGPGITDDGGIALTDAAGSVIDQVGMSSGSVFREGSTLTPRTANGNSSYERRPGGAAGNGQDTDNNAADFFSIVSNPQNSGSDCLSGGGEPTNPQAVGTATPSEVIAGNKTLLVVTVVPGTNPASSAINVTGNLTSVGGNSSQQFFDDGTNGDQTAGDNRFSYLAAVAANTPVGAKSLAVSIADAQSRTASASIGLTVTAEEPAAQCGVERWSVKTGTDQDAGLVDLNSVTATTIAIMRSWTPPSPIPAARRAQPHETTVYAITGTLTLYKVEEDSDYHAVIQDASGNTIITELACACCVGDSSPFKSLITSARQKFDARLNATGNFQTANLPVFIKGVGFFDFPHGATGAAPNNVEIHPVLDIRFLESLNIPVLVDADVGGKKLIVSGLNFGPGAALYVNGVKQKTAFDSASGGVVLVAKKAGKKIARGSTVTIQVRNADGSASEIISFTRPN